MNDPRGSIWRKWDLHIHTPYSIVQHYGDRNSDKTWERFISDLESLPDEFKVIGICDYLFIDGYKKVLGYKQKGRLENIELILPVIEFRLKKFSGHREFKRINGHVIFSNELDPSVIEQQFLNQLYGKYQLSARISSDSNLNWAGSISLDSLTDLGKKIRKSIPRDEENQFNEPDLELGFNNINFIEEEIFKILGQSTFLENKYLTAIGKTEWDQLEWNDSSIAEKKDIVNKFKLVFTASETVSNFKKAKQSLINANVNNLLIDCSDAHHFSSSSDKDRIGNCITWIKADTTFDGFKYILKDQDRLFIGDEPEILKRVRNNKTKYIKSVFIDKRQDSDLDEIWFKKIKMDLNPELVSIIGNKGNGKSALVDILGLLGNSKNYKYFSFLRKNKFKRVPNRAEHFYAKLQWESIENSNDLEEKSLNDSVQEFEYEKLKYIPQNFFETLCNEEQEDFGKELRKVIFSHVPVEERLSANTIDDLISQKSKPIDIELGSLYKHMELTNIKLTNLILMSSEPYLKDLKKRLQIKEEELKAHNKSKPKEVPKPETDLKSKVEIENIKELMRKKKEEIENLQEKVDGLKLEKSDLLNKSQYTQNIISEIKDFENKYQVLKSELESLCLNIGVNFNELVNMKTNMEVIEQKNNKFNKRIKKIEDELNLDGIFDSKENEFIDNAITLLKKNEKILENLNEKLDAPNKKYQTYLNELNSWDNKKTTIIGDENTVNSINFLEKKIKYISVELGNDIERLRTIQIEKAKDIYEKNKEKLGIYKAYYKPVEDFISKHMFSKKRYNLNLDVSFKLDKFENNFFNFINQKVKGSFSGIDEGTKRLKEIIEITDFNEESSVLDFLKCMIKNLEFDTRTCNKEKRFIIDQLRNENQLTNFYNFLFSFKYLRPIYDLKLGETELFLLSPGEKGAVLLIFYLLLDKDDIPLILDQPEENIDNQSIAEILVPFIKEAKKRRQIIIVTHNPNLAVVCDSEQIIYSKIDKTHKYKVTYETGSIENTKINSRVVDVLEGTLPAFNIRDDKYEITKIKNI